MNFRVFLWFFILLLTNACQKKEISPVGSAKITFTSNLEQVSLSYSVFTEAGYDKYRKLLTGQSKLLSEKPNVYEVIIEDLNPGTYIIEYGYLNAHFTFQVTQGRQRVYIFK